MATDCFGSRYLTSITSRWTHIAYSLSRTLRRQSETVKPHLRRRMAYKDRPILPLRITHEHHTLHRTDILRRIQVLGSGIPMCIHMVPVDIPLRLLAETTVRLHAA